mmetsp:Transcript_65919/g.157630  ORF Transcript_65919/g.157630 Transcript_65919/m.157630 type:complete len:419 (+) Transcript_65919:100-1356(+)
MATVAEDASPSISSSAAESAPSDFDLEATINRFLADENTLSLELPRTLTAEQRKQTRRLADQHPGVKCESFGFGAERQLHLFKKGAPPPGQAASTVAGQDNGGGTVRVKNTFIDDWVAGEEGGEKEPVQFRSMPVSLLQRTLQRCLVEGGDKIDLPTTMEELQASESVSSPRSDAANPADIDLAAHAALPPLPDGLKVRNTFIHIETMPVVNRIVQSMPDGMFQQCLEAELSAQSAAEASVSSTTAPAPPTQAPSKAPPQLLATTVIAEPPTAAPLTTPKVGPDPSIQPPPPSRPAPDPAAQSALAPGAEVEITRLLKLPDFNGLTGVIQSYDAESGRYDVLLNSATGTAGWRWVKVKVENLIPRVPPPPRRDAPTIVTDAESGAAATLATPKWEEDFAIQGGSQPRGAATLKLNSLV